jgi:hypothetical protein
MAMKESARMACGGVLMLAIGLPAVAMENDIVSPLGCVLAAAGLWWLVGAFCAWRMGS